MNLLKTLENDSKQLWIQLTPNHVTSIGLHNTVCTVDVVKKRKIKF